MVEPVFKPNLGWIQQRSRTCMIAESKEVGGEMWIKSDSKIEDGHRYTLITANIDKPHFLDQLHPYKSAPYLVNHSTMYCILLYISCTHRSVQPGKTLQNYMHGSASTLWA